MKVLAPIDGSDCSVRALEFAAEFVERYEGQLDVVHFAGSETGPARDIMARAEEILEGRDLTTHSEIVTELELRDPRYGDQVGKDILHLVEQGEYDHVVMGHHGGGVVGRLVLGSAAKTVIKAAETPVTIIP